MHADEEFGDEPPRHHNNENSRGIGRGASGAGRPSDAPAASFLGDSSDRRDVHADSSTHRRRSPDRFDYVTPGQFDSPHDRYDSRYSFRHDPAEQQRLNQGILQTLGQITDTLACTAQTSASSNPLKGHRLPIFTGSSDSDFMSWRDQVVSMFDFLKWSNDDRARYLPVILSKRAKQTYDALDDDVRDDFTDVMDALEATFGLMRKPLMLRNKLLRQPQSSTESVSSYTDRMMETFRKLNLTDHQLMLSEYVSGLRPAIQADVEKALPSDLTHAINLSEASEQSMRLNPSVDMEKLTQLVSKLETKLDAGTKSLNPATLNMVDSDSTRFAPRSRGSSYQRPLRQRQVRGRRGHYQSGSSSFYDASRTHTSNTRWPYCFRCARRHPYGQHVTRPSFPQSRPQRSRGTGSPQGTRNACFKCSKMGHFAAECRSTQ